MLLVKFNKVIIIQWQTPALDSLMRLWKNFELQLSPDGEGLYWLHVLQSDSLWLCNHGYRGRVIIMVCTHGSLHVIRSWGCVVILMVLRRNPDVCHDFQEFVVDAVRKDVYILTSLFASNQMPSIGKESIISV